MADFTSSLYLGMRHAGSELPGWSALTTGRPSALHRPVAVDAVAESLAGLQGAERAMLARSTLHAFSDCLDVLACTGSALVVDAAVYPVARWAVQRAMGVGVPVSSVDHQDVGDLARALMTVRRRGLRPVVVVDGVCGGCARPYPMVDAAGQVRADGGVLVIDDTQAIGLFGRRSGGRPFGTGGGGSVRRAGLPFRDIVAVASLAKAFGVPVTSIAGPAEIIGRVERFGGSATHSSPPSTVDIAAAANALDRNDTEGDLLRCLLASRIRTLRLRCARHGLHLAGGLFPVQATPAVGVATGRELLGRLAARGVHAVLRRGCGRTGAVALVVTAAHRAADVRSAGDVLAAEWLAVRHGARRAR